MGVRARRAGWPWNATCQGPGLEEHAPRAWPRETRAAGLPEIHGRIGALAPRARLLPLRTADRNISSALKSKRGLRPCHGACVSAELTAAPSAGVGILFERAAPVWTCESASGDGGDDCEGFGDGAPGIRIVGALLSGLFLTHLYVLSCGMHASPLLLTMARGQANTNIPLATAASS